MDFFGLRKKYKKSTFLYYIDSRESNQYISIHPYIKEKFEHIQSDLFNICFNIILK